MKVTYSNKLAREVWGGRLEYLKRFVAAPKKTLVKVFCGRDRAHYRSNYRFVPYHGWYRNERRWVGWGYEHVITLHLTPMMKDARALYVLAHEVGHARHWQRYRGSRWKCAQKRCDGYADRCVARFEAARIARIGQQYREIMGRFKQYWSKGGNDEKEV